MNAKPISEGDYPKLDNQPLTLVVADIRTSPVLNLGRYIPEIQDAIRKSLPHFYVQNTPSVHLGPKGITHGELDNAWVFQRADKTQALVLHQRGILFFSSTYDRFPGFLESLGHYVRIVGETIYPEKIERIGLRYNDYVSPDEGESLSQYVVNPIAPAAPDQFTFGQQIISHRTETRFATRENESLKIGCIAGYLTSAVMPDLFSPLPVAIQRIPDTEHISAVLDFDHFWRPPESTDFDTDQVLEIAESLHNAAITAFFEVTTPWARDKKWS